MRECKPQQLVVLGQALGAARRARLDLPGAQAHNQVRNEGVLRLAAAVAHLRRWACDVAAHRRTITPQPFSCDSLQASIDSEMEPIWLILSSRQLHALCSSAVAMLRRVMSARQAPGAAPLRVGDRQIVANNLDARAGIERRPARPVVLLEAVLDGDDCCRERRPKRRWAGKLG